MITLRQFGHAPNQNVAANIAVEGPVALDVKHEVAQRAAAEEFAARQPGRAPRSGQRSSYGTRRTVFDSRSSGSGMPMTVDRSYFKSLA